MSISVKFVRFNSNTLRRLTMESRIENTMLASAASVYVEAIRYVCRCV